jgi:hypothetical protein
MPNLLHFLLDLGVLYALHRAPNFNEIHPWPINCILRDLQRKQTA